VSTSHFRLKESRNGAGHGPSRRDDVLAFSGDAAVVLPLAFSSTIKDMKALLHNA
jgi:hypothetical protein